MRPPRRLVPALAAAAALAACRTPAPPAPATAGGTIAPVLSAELAPASRRWVDATLAALSLEEKAAQTVVVWVRGRYLNPDAREHRELLAEVRDLGVGGVILGNSELESVPRVLNELQAAARVPLLVSADAERGMSFRVPDGPVPLPSAMAVGATRSPEAARFTGEVTAREGRALGVHWALAPVADVNNNPRNPVINVRSYGEDPELVATMVAAFVAGARAGGMLTTAKHFPGHGDTAVDSHLDLPVLAADRARLQEVEWVPFRRAIAAGVDTVMTAHVAVPALDPSRAPATLSPLLSAGLLREELGFRGLIVTDALDMAALRPLWTGAAAVRALAAGADVLLLPDDPRVAVAAVARAVAEGALPAARLDEAARRVLEVKARLGLDRRRFVDPGALGAAVARPEDMARARDVARRSITLVRNQGDVLPLRAETPLRLLHLSLTTHVNDRSVRGIPEAELGRRRVPVATRSLGPEVSEESLAEIAAAAAEATHVLVSSFVRMRSAQGYADLSPSQVRLLRALHATGKPVVLLSFGSPYLLLQVPEIPVYVCAYGPEPSSQAAAVEALFGEQDVAGKLPVTLPGLYPYGHGLELPRRALGLRAATTPEEAGFRPEGLAEVDRLLEEFRARGAFPGGVLAVGHSGALVHLHPFGRLTYAADSPPVAADTLYDLASLTKIVATTTMAMILVDEGRLDLEAPVQDFLPGFRGSGKEAVTVRHLLTHSSGIDWWAPLYEEIAGKRAYLERIQAADLAYPPGSQSKYSDLGMILLGEILERVAGEPLEEFIRRRVLQPLGMADTTFKPPAELWPRVAPTEFDAWRGRLLQGEVHDENAFALGGVAPHAGLFGTASDLARFAQTMLWGGVFEHHRMAARSTVELFSRRAGVPSSDRALGWDTKSATGSSAGALFSPLSFGHTGFTGTSMWIDPERELYVILLTNRVHPTRDNNLIRQARPAVADAVVRALAEPFAGLATPPVRAGLDRVAAGEPEALAALAGKRLGLVAHAASVTADGRHAVDVLRARGLTVVRLFAPEHGLRGEAAAGERVESGIDPETGLPVVSLYGERRQPRPEDLRDLDALVFDLQDAGVRFYTYGSTLILAMESAAAAGVELVVLDRPNPLGGERVEGPLAAPREVAPSSFLNLAPGPLVHGLTLGEMARLVNAGRERPARLTVVPMAGWSRAMTWSDTGRPWVPPSPNLRSAEAALAYPGTCLLEATNVSEGRGTESPFLLLGAPWLDVAAAGVAVPGFALAPAEFTPRPSAAAPSPKYPNEPCRGLRVQVTDDDRAEPYRLGVALLARLSRQSGFEWRDQGRALTRLVGTPRLLELLRAGAEVEAILAADAADHEAWRRERRAALLYPDSLESLNP